MTSSPSPDAIGPDRGGFANGFSADTAAFEVRYDQKLTVWDRAGEAWTDISAIWSDVPEINAQPNMQTFSFGDYQVRLELSTAAVVLKFPEPGTISDYAERCDAVMSAVAAHFDVKTLRRVGFRLLLFRPVRDKTAAVTLLRRTDLFTPPRVSFNVHGDEIGLERVVVVEGQSRGVRLHVRSEERKVEFVPPFAGTGLTRRSLDVHGVVVDIDYYVRSETKLSSIQPKTWIPETLHVIERDLRALFKEKP